MITVDLLPPPFLVAPDKARALAVIRKAQKGHKSPALDFIALALNGKKIGFAKALRGFQGYGFHLSTRIILRFLNNCLV